MNQVAESSRVATIVHYASGMQTVLSRSWTWVANFISNNYNNYTKCDSNMWLQHAPYKWKKQKQVKWIQKILKKENSLM